jgi:hypothetical protein
MVYVDWINLAHGKSRVAIFEHGDEHFKSIKRVKSISKQLSDYQLLISGPGK